MVGDLKIIIIAAGKGTRIYDATHPCPKVLKLAAGRPLLSYVLDNALNCGVPAQDITIVVGFMKEMVEKAFASSGCRFAVQGDAAYGTGYAVRCGLEAAGLRDADCTVLVMQGDVPTIRSETVKNLLALHRKEGNAVTLLSCETEQKLPFGRIVRENGRVRAIVEDKDCTPAQKLIKELNVGLYAFDCRKLNGALNRLSCDNRAGEYYLTDVPGILLGDGEKVDAYVSHDDGELFGVNTAQDLEIVGKILNSR